ncbi:hypothetical protein [Bacillus toyonensis]|uniref:hypothetical protein n=1 Tax=Bacillus toyonensis TaxID=155322 RepID=UPI002E237663|nr:hypothetical protein [Bacillus toyonensis]
MNETMKVNGRISVSIEVDKKHFNIDEEGAVEKAINEGNLIVNDNENYLPESWNTFKNPVGEGDVVFSTPVTFFLTPDIIKKRITSVSDELKATERKINAGDDSLKDEANILKGRLQELEWVKGFLEGKEIK